jgi:peptidoglycan/LPS O-acetylase OafA/YrhL
MVKRTRSEACPEHPCKTQCTFLRNQMKYRPEIDGLRAIAVSAVVLFHAFPSWIKGGFTGVDVFFVISGYLISKIILIDFEKGEFNFANFYGRRIKRIFPALIVVVAACLAAGWFVLLADELNQLGSHIAGAAGFVSNLVLWGESGYFDNSAETKPLLHLWSLGIEEQFYLLWPLILWVAWRRKFGILTVTAFVALISFLLNLKGVKQDPVATFYSPQTRFWELAFGSMLAWATLHKKDVLPRIEKMLTFCLPRAIWSGNQAIDGKEVANFLSLIGLALLAFGFWGINKRFSFPGIWATIPVTGAVLIIAAGSKAWVNRTILSSKVAVWLGLISFPLYLWHWPLLSFARIVEGTTPNPQVSAIAIALSILLSWLTVNFIEKPARFGKVGANLAVVSLSCGLASLGIFGFYISKINLSQTQVYEKLLIQRKGFEHALGSSLLWYKGKSDWLFLGNATDQTVAKLKLSIVPSESEINANTEIFSKIANTGKKYNTQIAIFVGPNKSSIYPEYLPDILTPAQKKYSSYFLDGLKNMTNLVVYNPTDDFLVLKNSEGYLYWKTDTHWNKKGAFLAYSGFAKLLDLPIPQVDFEQGSYHRGDLVKLSRMKDFPLHPDDNWSAVWKNQPMWTKSRITGEQETAFGAAKVVINHKPLSNQYVWIVGDSFTGALEPYFNATFKEVRYLGHWEEKLQDLPDILAGVDRKPDKIIVVRVERTF